MTRTIKVEYETAPGTQVDGGYFVPDIFVVVRRKGFIGWIFRLFGSRCGYEEVKMYDALLAEPIALGRAVELPRRTVTFETLDGDYEFDADSEGLRKFLEDMFGEAK